MAQTRPDVWGPPAPPSWGENGTRFVASPEAVAKWKGDAAWILAGRMLDVGTTEWALAHNSRLAEGNWLMRDQKVRIATNAAYVGFGAWGCRELRKNGRPGWAKWLSRGVFIVSAGLATNAMIQAGR